MRLIDADAAKNEYWELMKELTKATIEPLPDNAIGALAGYSIIENAPTVDAVPVVRGRWIKMTGMMPPEYHGHYECSVCGWHIRGLRNSWTREEELLYCPNCGAKMSGDDEND